MLQTCHSLSRDCNSSFGDSPSTMPLANRLVHDGIFAEICRIFRPSLDLTDPELNDPEAHRQIPRRVRVDRMALASLAQVYRAFAEVALDALWKQLDSPVPLLRLLLSGVRRVPVDDPKLAKDPFEGGVLVHRLFFCPSYHSMTVALPRSPSACVHRGNVNGLDSTLYE